MSEQSSSSANIAADTENPDKDAETKRLQEWVAMLEKRLELLQDPDLEGRYARGKAENEILSGKSRRRDKKIYKLTGKKITLEENEEKVKAKIAKKSIENREMRQKLVVLESENEGHVLEIEELEENNEKLRMENQELEKNIPGPSGRGRGRPKKENVIKEEVDSSDDEEFDNDGKSETINKKPKRKSLAQREQQYMLIDMKTPSGQISAKRPRPSKYTC